MERLGSGARPAALDSRDRDGEGHRFRDRDSHPNGLGAGLTATRIGLVLLLIAVAVALVVAAGVTFLGLTWLPDSEFVTAATGWLWLPVAAGAGAVYQLWSVQRLE